MEFRLPDGKITRSQSIWINAWRTKASVIENITGMTHYAFDPGITFIDDDGNSIQLPMWFINKVEEKIKTS